MTNRSQRRGAYTRGRSGRRTQLAAGLGALCLGWLLSAAAPAEAAPVHPLSLSATVGFAGYYKSDQWVPVTVTIQNPDDPVLAELDVAVYAQLPGGRLSNTALRWVRTLVHGTQTIQIWVPGPVLAQSPLLQCFVAGRLVATTYLGGNAVDNVSLAAVLSPYPQDAQFLTGSSDGGTSAGEGGTGSSSEPVLPVSIRSRTLPASPNLLDGLALVAASPYALAELTPEQTASLRTWVEMGGLLLVTGCADPGPAWRASLPLRPGPARTVSAQGLAALAGTAASPPATTVISTAAGIRKGAQVWAGTSDAPLIAAVPLGRGTIVETAFVPRELLTWPGNAALWTGLMRKAHVGTVQALPSLFGASGPLSLAAASDALAPMRMPSLRVWLGIFLAYVVIAGPGVFLLLRRWKREPWAWVILPILGAATTAGIYAMGMTSRPNGMLTEGVGVLDLLGDGQAEVYGIRAFMSPLITSATVRTRQPMLMLPLAEQNVLPELATVTDDGRRTDVAFADVARWGVRYVYTAGAVSGQGGLETWIVASGSELSGVVRNTTPYPLHDVAVCWMGQVYTLGDIPPGATAMIGTKPSLSFAGMDLLSAYGSYNRDLTRGIGRPLGALAANLVSPPADAGQALILATTDAATPALPAVDAGQRVVSDQTMVLVRQLVQVGEDTGIGGAIRDSNTKPH